MPRTQSALCWTLQYFDAELTSKDVFDELRARCSFRTVVVARKHVPSLSCKYSILVHIGHSWRISPADHNFEVNGVLPAVKVARNFYSSMKALKNTTGLLCHGLDPMVMLESPQALRTQVAKDLLAEQNFDLVVRKYPPEFLSWRKLRKSHLAIWGWPETFNLEYQGSFKERSDSMLLSMYDLPDTRGPC